MMRDRRTAWAPVGLDIAGAKNIDEALRMADLNFEVYKRPIFDEFGNEVPKWYRNVRTDDNTTLGIVTDKYKIVQNRDAFDFVNNLIPEGVEFEKGGIWHLGKAIWLEAKLPTNYKILGDDVDCHVVFINSHDGKGAVKVSLIPNRLFCSNQLNFALKHAQRSWSVIHSSKIDTKIIEAKNTICNADTYMKAMNADASRLALKKMSDAEFNNILDKIYPTDASASNRKIANITEIKNGIVECLTAPDLANYKGTALEKLYAVTDYFDHRDSQRKTGMFNDARWESIANGDRIIDKFYEAIAA